MLQEGIYYLGGMAEHFRLLQLNVENGATRIETRQGLKSIWDMLGELTHGKVGDLRKELRPDDPDVVLASGELQVLLGYGRRFFDDRHHAPALTDRGNRPLKLVYLRSRNDTQPFPKLNWSDRTDPRLDPANPITTHSDLVLQFTANTVLAVERAIVETSKMIRRDGLPFRIARFYGGSRRDDRRSWIDFHDGINNMSKAERKIAIEIVGADKAWLIGGTYLSFMQIGVNLAVWDSLSRESQELLVGRDKITACPLVDSVPSFGGTPTKPIFMTGCPMDYDLPKPVPSLVLDPPQPSDTVARAAHIYRSNLNRLGPAQDANNRIYRQGYEFVENEPDGGILQGLNFVAFHRRMRALTDILTQRFWMGNVNFGGVPTNDPNLTPPIQLMNLFHGAFYAIPPLSGDFPGSTLLD